MRLKSLWINGFKNLKEFNIDFENRDGITVLIGNNASGKSNILEAISAIFAGLYNATLDELNFKFDIIYNIYDADIRISKKQKIKYRIKKPDNKSWNVSKNFYELGFALSSETTPQTLKKYQPSQVIALYSGEELRLWESWYKDFYVSFFNDILNQKADTFTPKMLYINKYSWTLGLIALFCSDKDKIKKFIKEHYYALYEGIDINFVIDETKYKKFKDNAALTLIKRIKSLSADGFINTNTLKTLDIGTQQIKTKQIFEYLYIASSPDSKGRLGVKIQRIIDSISIKQIDIESLSEGHKKQILLKLALEVLAGKNSLLLFDEPDAHIHISNKEKIPKMLEKYDNREIVLTTHSPTLAHSFDNKHLAYVENGKINTEYNDKEKLLNELTNDFMGVSEQQILLQSNKDILIVEGKTDEAYISAALSALKEDNEEYKDLDFNFLWLGGTDKDNLNKIIETFPPKENQTIIAFFDRDGPGVECIKKVLGKESIDKKNFKGGIKNGIHIYFYPKKDGFTKSNFEVEDYFPIKVLSEFIFAEIETFENLKRNFKKFKFAEKCKEDDFGKSNFDGFKALFDEIIKIKKAGKNQSRAKN